MTEVSTLFFRIAEASQKVSIISIENPDWMSSIGNRDAMIVEKADYILISHYVRDIASNA